MLYNPKWEKMTEAKPLLPSIQDLAAWLETMPSDGAYIWGDISNCALCQYCKARGFSLSGVDGGYWRIAQILGMENVASAAPQTFGAMLSRVRAKLGGI